MEFNPVKWDCKLITVDLDLETIRKYIHEQEKEGQK